jgi:hypothetical protein
LRCKLLRDGVAGLASKSGDIRDDMREDRVPYLESCGVVEVLDEPSPAGRDSRAAAAAVRDGVWPCYSESGRESHRNRRQT